MQKLCFPGRTISCVHKVVATMKQQGFIEAATYDLGRRGKLENVHTLTHKGWKWLVENNFMDESCNKFLLKRAPNMLADYAHRMAIVDYWISLELDIQQDPRFELALFVPEFKRLHSGKCITLKYDTGQGLHWQVRNDAIFIIADVLAEREFLFLLEIDRGTTPINPSKAPMQPLARNYLASKLIKIQKLLSVSDVVFPSLGKRFADFQGTRVIVVTSSAKRVVNIIRTVPIHEELIRQQVFLFSYFGEVNRGAFGCRYAVSYYQNGETFIATKQLARKPTTN